MDLNFLQEFVIPVILFTCLCVGYIIKKWVADVDNKYIPTIVSVLGVFLAVWMNGFAISPEILLTGLVSGLGSTGLYEAFRNWLEKD